MDDRQGNILEALVNMREFNAANAADYAALPDAAAQFGRMAAAEEAIRGHAATQASGAGGQAVEQKSVLAAAIRRKLTNIARTARGLNFADEGFRRLFRVPDDNNSQKLLAAAREFATQAQAHKPDFMRRGMNVNFVDDLNDDIADYEQATSDKASAHGAGVGATAALNTAIDDALEAITIADSIMHNVYENNPAKLAEWTRARHIKRSPKKKPKPTPTP